MKNIMIIKNSIYNTFRVLTHKTTILFIITVLLISCNGTEEICNDKNIDYLDIEFQDTRKFTSTELNIIYAAIQRIEKHASFDGTNLTIKVKSANEVNMSDNLFDYILNSINTSYLYQKQDAISFQRIKTRASETFDAGFGYYQWTAELDHDETLTFLNEAQSDYSRTGFIAALASTSLSKCTSVLVGAYFFFNGEYWSNKESEYLKKSNKNGCKVIQTTYTATSMGFPYTTYQLVFN